MALLCFMKVLMQRANPALHLTRKNIGLNPRRLCESAIHSAAQVSFCYMQIHGMNHAIINCHADYLHVLRNHHSNVLFPWGTLRIFMPTTKS